MYTGLIVVNAHPMKITVLHHIAACAAALLARLEARQKASNEDISAACEAQERRVLRAPATTEECLQLARDIAAAEGQLVQLRAQIGRNKEVDRFLDDRWCVRVDRWTANDTGSCHARSHAVRRARTGGRSSQLLRPTFVHRVAPRAPVARLGRGVDVSTEPPAAA